MKKKHRRDLYLSLWLFVAFMLWTIAVRFVDIKAIGPGGSMVGFSSINAFVHKLTGVHMPLYYITDWLGLVPIFVALGFAFLGLAQWIGRRKLRMVDASILILGGFYIVVMTVYLLFETVTVNYRPVLIDGILETSYPSSTTLLVISVMSTAIMQFNSRINNTVLKKGVSLFITAFILFMVVGRLIAGVHWFTDIVGGVLISISLAMLYRYFVGLIRNSEVPVNTTTKR